MTKPKPVAFIQTTTTQKGWVEVMAFPPLGRGSARGDLYYAGRDAEQARKAVKQATRALRAKGWRVENMTWTGVVRRG